MAAQARRIKSPQDTFERVPDTFLQVLALRQVLHAAEMAAGQADPESHHGIHDALAQFFDALVVETNAADRAEAFRTARNVLEHFHEYFQGMGNMQRRAKRDDPISAERTSLSAFASNSRAQLTVHNFGSARCGPQIHSWSSISSNLPPLVGSA